MSNMNLKVVALFVATMAIGIGRCFVPTRTGLSPALSYEAFAHLWVGFLAGIAAGCWKTDKEVSRFALVFAGLVSGFELAMFLFAR